MASIQPAECYAHTDADDLLRGSMRKPRPRKPRISDYRWSDGRVVIARRTERKDE